jgi:hypothetical protein
MSDTLPRAPSSPVDQIPAPEVIVRRLGETAAERRVLRALLRVAKLKKQEITASVKATQEVAGA